MVNLEGSCIIKIGTATSATLRVLTLANESTPRFDELMCAVGKLLLAFNILEHEIKSATCFLVNPDHPDLYSPDKERRSFTKRINRLKNLFAGKLSLEDEVRVKVILDQAKVLANERHFPAHSLVYSSGDGEFLFQKFAETIESQVGTPEEIMAKVKKLQSWTAEFAYLFEQLFPLYPSWYRQVTSNQS